MKTEQQATTEKDNVDTQYGFQEEVYIQKGFYKGRYAVIEAYNQKTKKYTASITIDKATGKKDRIQIADDDIRPVKKLGFFGI